MSQSAGGAPATGRPPVTLATKLFYGFGSVAYGVKDNGFAYLLLIYYSQVLGLPQQEVGLAIMIALLADSLIDPVVGYLSDNYRSKWGRRHPFMYMTAVPVAISYFLLWNPPAGHSTADLFIYLLFTAIFVRTFITFFEIPSSSLVAELTEHYDERTSLLAYRQFFGWWGGLTIAVIAFGVFLRPDANHPVGILNKDGYFAYSLTASAIILFAILISAIGTHSRIPFLRQPPENRGFNIARSFREIWETLANRSFVALMGAAFFGAMGIGVTAALNMYFNTYFWEFTSDDISFLLLGNFLSALLALFIAPLFSKWFGKKHAAIATAIISVLAGPAPIVLRLLGMFPANKTPELLMTIFAFNTVVVAIAIVTFILLSSMIADVVEDSELKTKRRSEGLFFATNAFIQKSVSGVGIFFSTVLLAVIGFPADAKPGEVDPAIIHNLGLIYVPTLTAIYLLSVACLTGYRISRASHAANLERLGTETA